MNSDIYFNFNLFLEQHLNPEQQKAVTPKQSILVVRAGAGSGKTRVITARMTHLILNHTIPASEILALTFTNKAAREMRERIELFLGQQAYILPYVGTFHSYCLRLLKTYAHLLPLPHGTFSLIDESDQEKLVKNILFKNGLTKKVAAKQVLDFISRIKNDIIISTERDILWNHNPIFKELYRMYEYEKQAAHCLDFDDLLLNTLHLFERNEQFKQDFQTRVRHVLVDEYQDTNRVQHALLKAMTQNIDQKFALDSLCVVGDEDQSIYSWRGAAVTNILNFTSDFPDAQSIIIAQNYRSVQPILSVANNVIAHNTCRNPKELWSGKIALDRIRLLSCSSGYQEAQVLSAFLKQSAQKTNLNGHAILYRSHFQSRALEEALIRNGIPYKIMGGIQFYDRQEIKDLLSYLRLIANPFDRFAFSRIINIPTRGLGDKFEELFYNYWDNQPFLDFKQIAQVILASQQLTKTKQEALKVFLNIFDSITLQDYASTVLTHILTKTGYYAYLAQSFEKEDAEAKRENIKELLNSMVYLEEQTQQTLEFFLQEVALLQEQILAAQETQECVRLMTFHAAKGLEFDTVLLTGLEDGILPSTRSFNQPAMIEEERRLLYVGITRAKERLLITHAKYRYTFGQMTEQNPSRFIDELAHEYIIRHDCAHWNSNYLDNYFLQWLTNSPQTVSLAQAKIIQSSHDHSYTIQANIPQQWSLSQQVSHEQFGSGIVEKIEQRSNTTYLIIRFKNGIKKLSSNFVKVLNH